MRDRSCRLAVVLVAALGALNGCGSGTEPAPGDSGGAPSQADRPKTIPWGVPSDGLASGPQAAATQAYAFHINFLIDESAGQCSPKVPCNVPFIPRSVLYFRGNLSVGGDRSVAGSGTMTFLDMQPCRVLMPDISSCKAAPGSPGTFTVAGTAKPDPSGAGIRTLRLTMTLKDLPKVSATMTSAHPSGPVTISLDATYAHLLKSLFTNAKIFDTPFEVAPVILSGGISAATAANAGYTFEGTFEQTLRDGSLVHTMHGLGGLFFINPGTPMPAAATKTP